MRIYHHFDPAVASFATGKLERRPSLQIYSAGIPGYSFRSEIIGEFEQQRFEFREEEERRGWREDCGKFLDFSWR